MSFHESKSGELRISRGGRTVQTLGGAAAARVIRAIDAATSEEARQLVMAKSTGNYKRGNER